MKYKIIPWFVLNKNIKILPSIQWFLINKQDNCIALANHVHDTCPLKANKMKGKLTITDPSGFFFNSNL